MSSGPLLAAAVLCFTLGFPAAGHARQRQPTSTVSEVDALKRQVEGLAANQRAMQKQLDDIKALLGRAGTTPPQAAAPAPPPAASGTIIDTLIETAGAATKGAASAKVVIIEFSDYECPFCGRYSRDTLPLLIREYVDTGKVRYVFRNMPIEQLHRNAFGAAAAVECGGEQGKAWQLHDLLFNNQKGLDAGSIRTYARAAGVDVSRFDQCLTSDRMAQRIRRDQAEGKIAGAGSTPSFFIGMSTPGTTKVRTVRFIKGAKPYQTFKNTIDGILSSAR